MIKEKNFISVYVSKLMTKGKWGKSEKLFFNGLRGIKNKIREEKPLVILEKGVMNAGPELGLLKKKVGGSVYQIPVPLKERKVKGLGVHWIASAVNEGGFEKRDVWFLREILNAYNGEGKAVMKKENLYKVAKANRAFLKFLE